VRISGFDLFDLQVLIFWTLFHTIYKCFIFQYTFRHTINCLILVYVHSSILPLSYSPLSIRAKRFEPHTKISASTVSYTLIEY